MKKIRKGDEVIVIAGKDKGKIGKITMVVKGREKVIVSGINLARKHVKPNPNIQEQGGIKEIERPIAISNVMLYDPTAKKGSKVGIRVLKDGQRVRYFKASDQVVDVKE